MSDRSLYVENETMNHWPYLPKSERPSKFARAPREYMDSFFLALDAEASVHSCSRVEGECRFSMRLLARLTTALVGNSVSAPLPTDLW